MTALLAVCLAVTILGFAAALASADDDTGGGAA